MRLAALRRAGTTAGCALALAGAGEAQAFLYQPTFGGSIIRVAPETSSVDTLIRGATNAEGIVVGGGRVYWANEEAGTVGRANLDGSGVQPNFITGGPLPDPDFGIAVRAVAVDAEHIYWTDEGTLTDEEGNSTPVPTIARANLDGTGIDRDFIVGPDVAPSQLAVGATHIYWAAGAAVGRARLDGTDVDPALIVPAAHVTGVAVNETHVYWSNRAATFTIGRANLDGSAANRDFIADVGFPGAVAGDDTHVYWRNGTDAIGRANLDGSGKNITFVQTAVGPAGLAIDEGAPRPTSTTLSCAPDPVDVGALSTCTATVSDIGSAPPGTPFGRVLFAMTAGDGGFQTASGGSAVADCTLSAGDLGTASCSVLWRPFSANPAPRIAGTYQPSGASHAGSSGSTPVGVTVPDTSAPTTSIVLSPADPNANGFYASSVHVTVSASDPGGSVAGVRCVLDPATVPASYEDLPATRCPYTGAGADVTGDGQHVFYAAAIDAAGNAGTPVSRSFRIDTAPPDTAITAGPSGQYTPGPLDLRGLPRPVTNDSTPTFSFSSTEPGATFECRVDGGAFAPCGSPHTTTLLADGAHTIQVRALDAAGNRDPTAASLTFTVAPRCTLVGIKIPLGDAPVAICLVEERAGASVARRSTPRLRSVTVRLVRNGRTVATGKRRGAGPVRLQARQKVRPGIYRLRITARTTTKRALTGGGRVQIDRKSAKRLSATYSNRDSRRSA